MSFVAEKERENIRQRQAEEIALAKAKGKYLVHPQMNYETLSKEQKTVLKASIQNGEASRYRRAAKKNTFYKLLKEYEDRI
jgi:DNA invertase Pin-like site-specific DNA recombinase